MKKLDISIENASGEVKESIYEIIDYAQFQIASILNNTDSSDLSGIINVLSQIDSHLTQNNNISLENNDKHIRFIESRKYIIELCIRRMKFDGLRNENLEKVNKKLKELFMKIDK